MWPLNPAMFLRARRMEIPTREETYYLQHRGKSQPSIDRRKIYRRTRAGSSFSQLKAQSRLSCWISARCFLQTACSLTLCFYLGKECPGVRKWISYTHTYTHTEARPRLCIRLMEGAGRIVAARVIFTSACVILSIKAKRTAARHNSRQAGSTTAVQSSSSSEATGGGRREMLEQGNWKRDNGEGKK